MKKIKNKNAFTLIELIIVIAIIGILAAVLIPSISGYINKAHRGRDVELAGHMTTELTLYATEYNVNMDALTGIDVRTILSFSGQNLVPRKDKWVFAYDRTTNQVVVKDLNDTNGSVVFAAVPENPIDPTHIEENFFLISKGNSKVEQAVELMTNLKTKVDYTNAINLLSGSSYLSIIQKFNPDTTLFIGNDGAYTSATVGAPATKIVVLEQTSSLPLIDDDTFSRCNFSSITPTTILSNTIRVSEPESQLKNLFTDVQDIDLTKVKTIDLASFGSNAEGSSIYKMEFGPYAKDSFKQVISDKIISVLPGQGENEVIIKRSLTISYYNKEGLFARGKVIYAVLQNVIIPAEAGE